MAYPNDSTKTCAKCKTEQNLDNYHKSAKNGYKSRCKKCIKIDAAEYHKSIMKDEKKRILKNTKVSNWKKEQLVKNPNYYRDYYLLNHEVNKQKARSYYHDNNRIEYQREWQQKNRDACRKSTKRWQKNNSDLISIYHSHWTKINAEHVRIYNSRRRAKKRNATIHEFSDIQLYERMSVFGFKCSYCDGKFDHIDHVIPLSRGGKHCLSNLRPACQFCNLSKHNKKLSEWLQMRASK